MSGELNHKVVNHKYTTETCRVGIVGGTFDPIHNAHLHMAEVAKVECNLDFIWFIPAQIPPHKQEQDISSADDRLKMIKLAIDPIPYFQVSLLEYERAGPSYTIETIKEFSTLYPNYRFYFIIGADMVEYLPNWIQIDELVQLVTFIGVGRPGWKLHQEHEYSQYVIKAEMVLSYISSSIIRERKERGKSVRFLVPEKVYHYIEEKGLYE